jgi:hypothetical protein
MVCTPVSDTLKRFTVPSRMSSLTVAATSSMGTLGSTLVEQVDLVGLQSRERFVSHFPNAFGAAVKTAGRKAVLEAEFRGEA